MNTIGTVLLFACLAQAQEYRIVVLYETAKLELQTGDQVVATFSVCLPRVRPKLLPVTGKVARVKFHPPWYPTKETREYYKKKKGVELPSYLPPGDPLNAMGSAKVEIDYDTGSNINRLVKIHGTNDPGSIGQRISRGCIRLHNEDISRLAELIRGHPTLVEFR
ncbi:MAG: L,D-transpeptidase [Candidatus Doudnabacteria bacterium]|nr:L,D-transpeptidase [Candidatus Doudnabacteria bacterium]